MARRDRPERADTAARILSTAEELVQVRGFNGFSYGDIAAELHITTASLHYHFAGKAELGLALISGYARRFSEALTAIAARPIDARAKLYAYAALYADVLAAERMCLCGILAAEYHTLPVPMRNAVNKFFDDNETWLRKVLTDGQQAGTLHFTGSAGEAARTIIGGLEGAMLVARSYGDVSRFSVAANRLLASLVGDDGVAPTTKSGPRRQLPDADPRRRPALRSGGRRR
jgi:TetR/AcrR family transcriptional regulator, transcriptional repressor for nem operon